MSKKKDPEWLSASELGSYVYCAKAFEHKVMGVKVGRDQMKRLQRGTAKHHRHGVFYDLQVKARKVAMVALALAALVAAGVLAHAMGVL